MTNKLKVSIIVPVYNAETYVRACIKSIVKQTYKHLEIILVNDGSTDRSGKILQTFAKKDRRIKVLKHRNKGPSFSRNRGLAYATGDVVQFVDADDTLHRQMTARLVRNMGITADLVLCGYSYGKEPIVPFLKGTVNQEKFLEKFGEFYRATLFPSPCNKLYRLDIIRKQALSFPLYKSFGEDVLFNLRYLQHVRQVSITQDVLYYYRQHGESLTKAYIGDMFKTHEQIYQAIFQLLSKSNHWIGENNDIVATLFAEKIIQAATNIFHPNNPSNRQNKCQELRSLLAKPIVQEHLPYFTGSRQAQLFHYFIDKQSYKLACRYLRLKKSLQKTPLLNPILKKINRRFAS